MTELCADAPFIPSHEGTSSVFAKSTLAKGGTEGPCGELAIVEGPENDRVGNYWPELFAKVEGEGWLVAARAMEQSIVGVETTTDERPNHIRDKERIDEVERSVEWVGSATT